MNNNIIKSLRRTVLCTVAAAAVAIGFTACADDSLVTQNANTPANGNGYKFSIPANMGGGDTRAIAYNSESGGFDALFETTDRIFVYDVNKKAQGYKLNKWDGGEDQETAFLYPDANGKVANLCGEIDGFFTWNDDTQTWDDVTPEEGDTLMLFYNNGGQTLDYNRNFSREWYYNSEIADFAIATVTITSINGGVITTDPSFFWNPQSIYKVNFTGIDSDVKIKKMTIGSEQRKLVRYYNPTSVEWPNEFGNVTYIYKEEGMNQDDNLIFLLRFAGNPYYSDTVSVSGDELSFLAVGSDGYYYKGTKSVTTDLKNGMYYSAEVAMEKLGLAMTLTNDATGELVELSEWTYINTSYAAYTAENTGLETSLNWYGGDQTLTLKNVTVNNSNYNAFIDAQSDGSEDSRVHKLILEGENTTNGVWIGSYSSDCSLIVSSSSGGTWNINGGISMGINATMTIESGEVTASGISYYTNGRVLISGEGKLRVPRDLKDLSSLVKAAEGYVLQVKDTQDGYVEFTASPAPPHEWPLKVWVYGEDSTKEAPFSPGIWNSAVMRFSNAEGDHFRWLTDDEYFDLTKLIIDVSDASDDCTLRVMNGWWSAIYLDNVPVTNGQLDIQITEDMARDCARGNGGGSKDLVLMLLTGSCTINSVYYYLEE
jgi:hypothetical protein